MKVANFSMLIIRNDRNNMPEEQLDRLAEKFHDIITDEACTCYGMWRVEEDETGTD